MITPNPERTNKCVQFLQKPFEKQHELTRGALKLIDKYGFGIVIDTKSDLVVRDIDLLLKIKKHSPVIVNFTITTAFTNLWVILLRL